MSAARLAPWLSTAVTRCGSTATHSSLSPRFFSSSPLRLQSSSTTRQFFPSSLSLQPRLPTSTSTLLAKRPAPLSANPGSFLRSPFSLTSSLLKRTFSSSKSSAIRQTYYPRGGGGYGGSPRPGGSWWTNFKYRIDSIPSQFVIYGLIGINVAVFLIWQYAISSYQRFRDPALYRFMVDNFVLNEANVMAGRLWTLITSSFSHSSGTHILINCLGLYFVAPAAASLVGSAYFLGLYLGGGVVASLSSLLYHRMRGDRWAGSEGASGAIYASLAFYGALFPNTTFLLFFVVPMPAWLMIGGIFAWDLFSAFGRPNSGVDSSAHIGGILAGVAAASMVRRGRVGQVWRGGPRWR